jgi:hypothetical protein
MCWLNYTDDEVRRFHPVFEAAAFQALANTGLSGELRWIHHHRTPGNTLIPDFALVRNDNGRWVIALEIKRTSASIHSTRNQVQAQGYATTNSDLYSAGAPRYFAISNLEQTILFAQRAGLPPRDCRVSDGVYNLARFSERTEVDFRSELVNNLEAIVQRVSTDATPDFDEVWPRILSGFIQTAEALLGAPQVEEPTTPCWDIVRDYFCHTLALDSSRILILRCLLAEYIYGVLDRFEHPDIGNLLPLTRCDPGRVGSTIANALSRLRGVDFRILFEDDGVAAYRALGGDSTPRALSDYIWSITTPPLMVRELARDRLDRSEFLDGIVHALHEGERLDDRGKVLTDPELAALLAAATITTPEDVVVDPCCGDGALLEAAYARLINLGSGHASAVQQLRGIEVDPTLVRLAFLRVALQEPASIRAAVEPDIAQGDMFASSEAISSASVALMNPPFRRYENQDPHPLPEQLKSHYSRSIRAVAGRASITNTGQQNVFTYYVEFLVSASQPGCRFGIILDNKWYHNRYATPLREFLLRHCAIEALIEYPYANLFASWTIATSIMICRKADAVPADHMTKFIRCSLDLGQIDSADVRRVIEGVEPLPTGWSCREKLQRELDHRNGWKNHFADGLSHEFRAGLPALPELFEWGRRGSLAKEEGGMSAIAFPFDCRTFGSLREADPQPTRRYQNRIVRTLTRAENSDLQQLARRIDDTFRGYAINNSGTLTGYTLTEAQVLQQPTIEPPTLRGHRAYWSDRRVPWQPVHDRAVAELEADDAARSFISEFRRLTGLDDNLMPDEWLFVGLREPYAGELIIPRKMRRAHRVHVNPFACTAGNRQVRLSSNFVSFYRCRAIDSDSGLHRLEAIRLIAAFMISSFGHLQFETKGYNREGCLSVELHHLQQIHVIDPRILTHDERTRVLAAFDALPYPVPTNRLSRELPERNALDKIWADVICRQHEGWVGGDLLDEVHAVLDEYILAREP